LRIARPRALEEDWAQSLGEERFAELRATLRDMIAAGAGRRPG
jgi:hypothetical protein